MDLPGEQDELIRRICEANPRTVVVLNCGAPVTMPWHDDPAAILAIWFGGQEMAPALGDVLCGEAEPGGRLPCTLPERHEHTPAYGNFPGSDSQVRYGEGLLIGYRWYDTRQLGVQFPFGHGLSYASFILGAPHLSSPEFRPGEPLEVTVSVRNTSGRRGSEVVQLYVEPLSPLAFRPNRELKAFAKVTLDPGESADVVLTLDDRSFSRWDLGNPDHERIAARISTAGALAVEGQTRPAGWRIDPGEYAVHIGRSIADIAHVGTIQISA
jgi:beta-glucosidase